MPAHSLGDQRWDVVDESIPGQKTYTRARGHTSQLVPNTPEDLTELSKEEIQNRLKHMGLPVSGTKEELVERLNAGVADSDNGDNA